MPYMTKNRFFTKEHEIQTCLYAKRKLKAKSKPRNFLKISFPNSTIIFQDIKPANLLINKNDILKLADFGLSRIYFSDTDKGERPYSAQVASRYYRAPEILYGSQHYGPMMDIWAAGCVFAEMLRGGTPLFAVIKSN